MQNNGQNQLAIKYSNQSAIRKMIYLEGPVLRSAIADSLQLTLPTITTNIVKLINTGVVFNDKDAIVSTSGRSAQPVNIVADSRYFIGIEITTRVRELYLVDYRGSIVYQAADQTHLTAYDAVIQSAARLIIDAFLSESISRDKIYGIGVSMPGLIDSENGMLLAHRQYDWYNKTVVSDLRTLMASTLQNKGKDSDRLLSYNGPITLGNDAYARSLATQLFMRKELADIPSFLYLYVSTGIAAPYVRNDHSLSAANIGAGELGYMIMDAHAGFGSYGCLGSLNTVAGERVLKKNYAKIKGLPQDYDSSYIPVTQIIEDSKSNPEIEELVKTTCFYLGIAVANEDNLVRPSSILVDAEYFTDTTYRNYFADTIKKYSFRPNDFEFQFIYIDRNYINGPRSAAALAIRKDFDSYIE